MEAKRSQRLKNLQQWAVRSGSEETVLVPGVGRWLWAGLRALLLVAMAGMAVSTIHIGAQTPPELTDPYQWLEDVSGQRSMAWVQASRDVERGRHPGSTTGHAAL
jgi:hypothetical protein